MSKFTNIEHHQDDCLLLNPLIIEEHVPVPNCDSGFFKVKNNLSELKTEVLKREARKNLGISINGLTVDVIWNQDSNLNDFIYTGIYNITGERLNKNDNMPISNSNPGHTITAKLVVLNSSISGTGDLQDKCVTQILMLSNRTGGDGNTYVRTGSGVYLDTLTWSDWGTQLTNINVGQVDNLDNLKDNGVYSGVWTKGSYNAYPLTFVCVVINDYFLGVSPRRISLFLYGLSKLDGSVVYQSRIWDDSKNIWGNWEILNQKEISSMISVEIGKLVDKAPENLNTLKKLADNLTETKKNIANQLFAESSADEVTITGRNEQSMRLNFSADIPAATTETAGVMSAEDKKKLKNLAIEGTNTDLDTYYLDGVYFFSSKKLTNIPILNNSVVSARLTVLTAYDGSSPVITQVLNLNNLGGGEGNIYIRSMLNGTWKPWGKLQTNVEVGQVTSLDSFIDNGIYSGVYVKNAAEVETFVMVVINNYAAASQTGITKSISQFKYSVNLGGSFAKYETRVGTGVNDWSIWKILNQQEIASMISAEIKKVTDGIDTDKIDSIKDIIAWIDAHGGEVQAIYNAIEENTTAIMYETERAATAEVELNQKIVEIKNNAARYDGNAFNSTADEVTLTTTSIDTKNQYKVSLPAATTEHAGVMSANDKQKLEASAESFEFFAEEERVGLEISANSGNLSEAYIPAATPGSAGVMSAEDKVALDTATSRALRALFVAAGAEYNDTDNHIVKDTPWKNYVDSVDYKAQWDLDVVTGSVKTLTYGGKTYEYIDDNGTWKIIARVGDKLIWDDTKVIHRAGYYHLNGLGDITESQMMEVYDYTFPLTGASDWSSALRRIKYTDNSVRTNILKKDYYANNKIKVISGAFYGSKVEIVRLTGSNDIDWKVAIGSNVSQTAFGHAIADATKLRYVLGTLDFKNQKTDSLHFGTNASSINVLIIKNLVGSFKSFGNSKTISKSSVLYIIQNAIPTSAITITLHADAYARLKDDADIVSALEAQPLITLVSA